MKWGCFGGVGLGSLFFFQPYFFGGGARNYRPLSQFFFHFFWVGTAPLADRLSVRYWVGDQNWFLPILPITSVANKGRVEDNSKRSCCNPLNRVSSCSTRFIHFSSGFIHNRFRLKKSEGCLYHPPSKLILSTYSDTACPWSPPPPTFPSPKKASLG